MNDIWEEPDDDCDEEIDGELDGDCEGEPNELIEGLDELDGVLKEDNDGLEEILVEYEDDGLDEPDIEPE